MQYILDLNHWSYLAWPDDYLKILTLIFSQVKEMVMALLNESELTLPDHIIEAIINKVPILSSLLITLPFMQV